MQLQAEGMPGDRQCSNNLPYTTVQHKVHKAADAFRMSGDLLVLSQLHKTLHKRTMHNARALNHMPFTRATEIVKLQL